MTLGEKLKYAAFGCLCTLAGVLFTSFVLTLFAESKEYVFHERIACKELSVINDNGNIIASLDGGVYDGDYGALTLFDDDMENMVIIDSSSLSFSMDAQPVIVLETFVESGKLSFKNTATGGRIVVGEKEGEFALEIFSSKGVERGAGVSLGIEGDKGQIVLFGENKEILFGRGNFIYGE